MILGDAEYRSPYLSHAKRALYHLSYIPLDKWWGSGLCFAFSVSHLTKVALLRSVKQSRVSVSVTNPRQLSWQSGGLQSCNACSADIHRSLVQIRFEGGILFHFILLFCPHSNIFFFAVENVIHGQLTERNARRFQIFSVSTPVINSSIVQW